MKKTTLILLAILCTITMKAQNPYFKHLGTEDGLSQVRTQAIYQDETGAVWIGTAEGLSRYNGTSVKTYSLPDSLLSLSSGGIDQLCGNKQGKIYLLSQGTATEFDINKEKFRLFAQDIRSIFCEKDTLWTASKDGIYFYKQESEKPELFARFAETSYQATHLYVQKDTVWALSPIKLYAIPRKSPSAQKTLATFKGDTQCLYVDKSENIWVGTWNGVHRLSPSRSIIRYDSSSGQVSHNQIRCFTEDNKGNIWIGTYRGLDCYHPGSDSWSHYSDFGDSPNTLSHNSILTLYKDKDGNIWVGTYFGGVNVFNPGKDNNYFYYANPLRKDWLNFSVIGKMTEDNDGNLWICTEGGGLNCLDIRSGKFTHYMHKDEDPHSIGGNNLKSIYFHPETETLYTGTHLGGLYVLNVRTKQGHTLQHTKGDPHSLPNNIVNQIQPYQKGLLVLTQGGLVYMNRENEQFSDVSQNPEVRKVLRRPYAYETFLLDKHNRLWLGLSKGGVVCVDLTTSHISQYQSAPLSLGEITHIFEDRYGDIFVGSAGAGLFRYQRKEDKFKQYSLPSGFCYYIGEAKQNNCLYLIHGKGASLFNTQTEVVENTFRLFNQSYNNSSCLFRDRKGTLYIGGNNGLAVLKKENTELKPLKPHFDRLFIFSREVQPENGDGILSAILGKTDKLNLKHSQNNIAIEIATFDYLENIHSGFEYTLKGFDESWNRMQGNKITYTHLAPGNYTLRVRPLTAGDSSPLEASLKIHIAPPFYASTWAYIIYICIAGGILSVILSFIIRQTRLRTSLDIAKNEKRHIEEINQLKINFFTNVSHEFRTPLTLILGQLETLIQTDEIGNSVRNKLSRIYRNALEMRRLISELMDFRKQEQGGLALKVRALDLTDFIRKACQPFSEYAREKEINMKVKAQSEPLTAWIDPVQMKKVISNLLMCVLRYTSSKGWIDVEVQKIKDEGIITVTYAGTEVSEKAIRHVFEQFYQAEDTPGNLNVVTEIGLSVAKNIIELHHGTIDVSSEEGNSTRFTITLPLRETCFSQEELAYADEEPAVIADDKKSLALTSMLEENDYENEADEESDDADDANDSKPVLLLIENDRELCSILKDAFDATYHLYIANDGQKGWEKAHQLQPDLIICDVTLPDISGKELCYRIKNNVELAHVSVILLTGQSSSEQKIEAFRFGADDYIVKPFDVSVLQARCRNLLKNKSRLMAYCSNKAVLETTAEEAISEADRKLLQRCIDIIRENFTNQEFDVTALANSLCMGRSKLYTKFKKLVGLPPNEFMVKIKMEEAMALLKEHPELNVSEIASRLGFSSPRYFSKQFKTFFGITPQNVRSRKEE